MEHCCRGCHLWRWFRAWCNLVVCCWRTLVGIQILGWRNRGGAPVLRRLRATPRRPFLSGKEKQKRWVLSWFGGYVELKFKERVTLCYQVSIFCVANQNRMEWGGDRVKLVLFLEFSTFEMLCFFLLRFTLMFTLNNCFLGVKQQLYNELDFFVVLL